MPFDNAPGCDKVTELALALPEAVREEYGVHYGFNVRGKRFVYWLNDHHGDGRVAIWTKAGVGENMQLVNSDPVHFFIPPYVGVRGWVGYRLDIGEIDLKELHELIVDSYLLIAPKSLARQVAT